MSAVRLETKAKLTSCRDANIELTTDFAQLKMKNKELMDKNVELTEEIQRVHDIFKELERR